MTYQLLRLWVVCIACAATSQAAAQARELPESLSLAVSPCPQETIAWRDVRAQLAVELRASSSRVIESGPGELQVVLVLPGCSTVSGLAHVTLLATETGRSARAELVLAEMTPRQIALSIVELVREHWQRLARGDEDGLARIAALQELRAALEQRVAAVERAASEARTRLDEASAASSSADRAHERALRELERRPTPADAPGLRIGARAGVQAFVGSGAALAAFALAVELPLANVLTFRGRVQGAFADLEVVLGTVRFASAQGSVSVLTPYTTGFVSIALGPTLTLGWLHAEGIPRDPEATTGASADDLIGWAGLEASLGVAWTRELRAAITIEVAHTIVGFRGLAVDQPVASLSGPVILARVGVDFAP